MTSARRPAARRPAARRTGRRRRRSGGGRRAWLPLAVVAALVMGVVALVRAAGTLHPAALTGSCAVTGAELTLTSEQAASAATIAAVGRARGLPERAVVVALATAQQESRLRNLDYGDRDSLGLFQQRPSQGWGSEQQVQDPVYAAGRFYDGLVEVPGWQSARVTDAADAVQRSAFPEAYEQHVPLAQELTAALTAAEPGRLTCAYEPSSPGGRLSERTAAVAGAVEAELGVPATEEFGAVSVDPGAGWPGVTWAVANAERLALASVAFAGREWTPGAGWHPSGAADGEIRLRLVS